jgi:uncharacterized OB-fold protein
MSVPIPTAPEMDALAVEWWEATRERRLLVQHCASCDRYQHYPRTLCLACRGNDLSFAVSAGRATVQSFTTVHRAPSPDFTAPYVIALVRLEEGPLMLTRIVGSDEASLECDMPVALEWEPLEDGRNLPVWAPVGRS